MGTTGSAGCNAAIYGRNGNMRFGIGDGRRSGRWMINCSIPLILSAYNGRIMDQKIPQLLWEISWSYLSQQTMERKQKPLKTKLLSVCSTNISDSLTSV